MRIRKHIDYKHEELFFTCAKCSLVDILAHSSIAFQQFLCLAGLCSLAFPRSNACMPACRQAGTRASRLTGRQVNWQAGKNAFRFANLKTDRQATMFFSLAWQHLALSWQLEPYFRLGKHPTFAPKRQGKAESAYRRPRLRPSFGQQKGIGRPMPYKWVMAGLSPIRLPRIFVSSKTQQGVL